MGHDIVSHPITSSPVVPSSTATYPSIKLSTISLCLSTAYLETYISPTTRIPSWLPPINHHIICHITHTHSILPWSSAGQNFLSPPHLLTQCTTPPHPLITFLILLPFTASLLHLCFSCHHCTPSKRDMKPKVERNKHFFLVSKLKLILTLLLLT